MSDSQGGRANDHGWSNRKTVASMLLDHGFVEVGPFGFADPKRKDVAVELASLCRQHLERPALAFVQEAPICYSVHHGIYRASFLLTAPDWPAPLALMCKEQSVPGSADEKLEFMFATINERFPCRALVLLSGKGFGEGAVRRARQWSEKCDRVAGLFLSLDDVRVWLTNGHPYPATLGPDMFP